MFAHPGHLSGWNGSTCMSHLNVKRTKLSHPESGPAAILVNRFEQPPNSLAVRQGGNRLIILGLHIILVLCILIHETQAFY